MDACARDAGGQSSEFPQTPPNYDNIGGKQTHAEPTQSVQGDAAPLPLQLTGQVTATQTSDSGGVRLLAVLNCSAASGSSLASRSDARLDAAQLPGCLGTLLGSRVQGSSAADNEVTGFSSAPSTQPHSDAVQPAVLLGQEMLIRIRQEEAALGPPRSLHKMARKALDEIAQRPSYDSVDLQGVFPWKQYVAQHALSEKIVGTGIIRACAEFDEKKVDHNRGGAPRLEFCFYRSDSTCCRLHPGRTRKHDAAPRYTSHKL